MIAEFKQNIDIVSVVKSAGVDLQQRGTRHIGLCPLHAEKTPSFFVFDDNRFKCFGCQESGDVIDFVQKLHGLTFQDALKHLGIERGEITPQVRRDIEGRKRKAELLTQFRGWEEKYCSYVSKLWRRTRKLMLKIPPEDLELYAPLLQMLPLWEYHRDILIHGSDKLKYKLYKDKEARKWKRNLV